MLDKNSLRLLNALYKKDLPEEIVCKILKQTAPSRPGASLAQLKADKMISVRCIGGTPDGEGGFIDGTVNYVYHLEPSGKAEVENVRRTRLHWLIATGIALAAAIGAILSALPN